VLMALLPTLLYAYAISELGSTRGNLDMGLVWGSYFGLLFLVSAYTAISLFSSALTENQIVAFMAGLLLCFSLYYGFEAVSTIFSDGSLVLFIQNLGMKKHFESVASGVLDTRDLIYFLSLTLAFLFLTVVRLKTIDR
ncbi:MAG: gliding motility-associated ABC transporter permease subunit GldF, partial [Bacteroidota bacterium]